MAHLNKGQLPRLVLVKPGTYPLHDELAEFLIDRESQGFSPRTIQLYRLELHYFVDFAREQGISGLTDVTPDLIRRWLLRLGETRNAGGVHVSYRTLKTFLRWAWTEYELSAPCPIAKVRPPKLPQEILEPVSLDALKAMLDVCPRKTCAGDRDRAILLVLLDTGLRASELCALDIGDVNMTTGALIIRHGKGNKDRLTFLGATARKELARYLRHRSGEGDGAPLFATENGHRLAYSGLRSLVRRRAKQAGVKAPSLHSFRRAFALLSLKNGADVYSLQKMMGHADLTVLRRYLRQAEDDLAEVHKRTSPVDNMKGGRR